MRRLLACALLFVPAVAHAQTTTIGPPRFVFDADRLPVEVDGFDEGGADAAHRVEHEVAGCGVGGDRAACGRRQHSRRVRE